MQPLLSARSVPAMLTFLAEPSKAGDAIPEPSFDRIDSRLEGYLLQDSFHFFEVIAARLQGVRVGLLLRVAAAALAFAAAAGPFAVGAAEPGRDGSAGTALPRKPWTTSRVVGSPDPPPRYRAADAFPNLRFERPVHLTHAPGTDRLFVCQEYGKILSFPNRSDAKKADLFFDPAAELKNLDLTLGATAFDRTYALAFHPKFAENRFCYVCYTLKGAKGEALPDGTRISRFRVTDADPPRVDIASETILLTFLVGGHNGCDLQFGPDGHLYLSLGDAASPSPPDTLHTGQDITDLHSSVLRIDVDREDPGLRYAVPEDNPFVGLTVNGEPARPEVWAYGFRNPWRMSFDRETGDLWVGDVGWESWELVHNVESGGNYGWSVVEGRQSVNPDEPSGPTPILPPVIELPHTEAASVTGGFVYRGTKLPELFGAYVFGDWETRRVWAARIESGRLKSLEEIVSPTVRVVGFGEDRAGELYFLDHDTGVIHTLEKNDAQSNASTFPRTLSETGLFVSDQTPAEGVYPFAVNAVMWQDHATSEHWVALPGDSAIIDHERKKPIPGNVSWHNFRYHFPNDAVLAKTLSLEAERGDPASRRRVETQILHFDGSYWHGYTYAWRDDQTDADLVPAEGAEKVLIVKDPVFAGGTRRQIWTFNSRSQCLQCHSPWTEYTLAFNPHQLNRELDGPAGRQNQLVRLGRLGLLARAGADGRPLPPYSPAECSELPRLADPHDPAAPLGDRARAYLHVNCSHCHRTGGGSAGIDLQAFGRPESLEDLTGPARLGTFDLPDPRVIAPGEPHRSVLVYRMAKFNAGRMPHVGSELVDAAGVELVGRWVGSLGDGTPPAVLPAAGWTESRIADALRSPAEAMPLALAVATDTFPADLRKQVFAAVAALPPGPVRDLFDGYLPQDPSKRKLGRSPLPRALLALSGDPDRGRDLLVSTRLQCLNCHRLDGKGSDLGPDLSAAGRDRSREDLLESLLDPSRRVDAKYRAYVLITADGRVTTGALVHRDEAEVVLRDIRGEEVRAAAEDIERLEPSRESLMPAGLLADLTVDEAADLLSFLAGRKE